MADQRDDTAIAVTRPSWWARLATHVDTIGATADESESRRIARRTLVLGGLLMSGGGLLWGPIALLFGRTTAATIPFGYVVLTAINLALFARTRSFTTVRFIQVLISLVLPFGFQWALGGFIASGAVMLWAMVSIVGALTFSEGREALLWLLLYCVLTVFSGLIDPYLSDHVAFDATESIRIALLVLNLVVVSAVVFGLAIFLNTSRAKAVLSLEQANTSKKALNLSLSREIEARGAQLDELQQVQSALHLRTEELTASLEWLRTAQDELVRREKLAALGQLVAGVAHEVNTPLGVVYTAITLSRERIEQLEIDVSAGAVSRRQVLEAAKASREALAIASANAERAAKLISDFKRVAVDQTSEAVQTIELKSYLDAVVQSLSPMLSKAGVRVQCEGESVEMVTRPGIIAQVITNLLQNAMLHAYPEGTTERRVALRCRLDVDSVVVIEVEDWGVGMSADVARRVFEPFFTTRRGSGGSGLGMHIVHENVYGALGGTVVLDTEPGRGTRIALRIPVNDTREPSQPGITT
jgi:signal transduction histidine kinase